MAGSTAVEFKLRSTGLGSDVDFTEDVTLTDVPVERGGGTGSYVIISTAQTTALQLSDLAPHIALAKMTYFYLKAEVGDIYIQWDTAGTTTFAEAAAHSVVSAGDFIFVCLNPAGNLGVCIDGSAVTSAFTWYLEGKA